METWIQITSGQGPAECSRAVHLATQALLKWLSCQGIASRTLNMIADRNPDCYRSVLLSVTVDDEMILNEWQGTIQWICSSPFRPNHKRKNWFIAIELFHPPKEVSFKQSEIRIETMRSSGPGGQHVNTTDSAVRVTHVPTGITAIASEERSQVRNKALALARLVSQQERMKEDEKNAQKQSCRHAHYSLIRGNPVKTFRGLRFKGIR